MEQVKHSNNWDMTGAEPDLYIRDVRSIMRVGTVIGVKAGEPNGWLPLQQLLFHGAKRIS